MKMVNEKASIVKKVSGNGGSYLKFISVLES